MTITTETVGILGAGAGGLVTANVLRKALGGPNSITLIDRESDHYFPPSYLWAITGERDPAELHRPLEVLSRRGIDLVRGEIEAIEPEDRAVVVGGKRMTFDYLVLSLGADLKTDAIPGLQECHTFYSFQGTSRLRDAVRKFEGGPVLIVVTAMPYKCPAAPYEAAFLIDDLLRRYDLRSRPPIEIITVEPQPMPVAGPVIGKAVSDMLAARDITYTPNTKLMAVDHERRLATFADGDQRSFELIIAVPPHVAPQVVLASGLCDDTGWIPVDPTTLATRAECVYAIGDVTAIRLPNGKFLPKAGVFAHYQAEVVAKNIAAEIGGSEPEHRYEGYGQCFLEIGRGRAGYASGNFYAEPDPDVRLKKPSMWNHWGKIMFEKFWWRKWL